MADLTSRLKLRKSAGDEKIRIQIVLACVAGESGTAIAERLQVCVQTVSKWRRRYEAYGFAGLSDALRAGRPHTVPFVWHKSAKTILASVARALTKII